jgi:hypothetical protein
MYKIGFATATLFCWISAVFAGFNVTNVANCGGITCINGKCTSNCGDLVQGSGNVVRKTLKVQTFKRIRATGSVEAVIQQGAQEVVAEADDNLIDKITAEVEDGELVVSLESGSYSPTRLRVNVRIPALETITVEDSAEVTMRGFDQDSLRVEVSGSSSLEGPEVRARSLELKAVGSSKVHLRSAKADQVSLDLSGASRAELSVADGSELSGHLSGASRVSYCGTPAKIEVQTSGAARLKESARECP